MPQHWDDHALLAAWCTENGNYFPTFLFFTECSKVTVDEQPSTGEKGCPLRLRDSSHPRNLGCCPVRVWTSGQGGGLFMQWSQGRLKRVLRSHWNHWQLHWTRKRLQIFRLQGHWLPTFSLLWLWFQMPCGTHLQPGALTPSCAVLRHQGTSGTLPEKQKELSRWAPRPGCFVALETGSLAPTWAGRKSQDPGPKFIPPSPSFLTLGLYCSISSSHAYINEERCTLRESVENKIPENLQRGHL